MRIHRVKWMNDGAAVLLNGVSTVPYPFETTEGRYIQQWIDAGNEIEPEKTFLDVQRELLDVVKEDTYHIIVNQLPEWKQRNLIARSIEILDKGTLTQEEQDEKETIRAAWDWVQQVREDSNTVEENIESLQQQSDLDDNTLPIRMSDVHG